MVADACAGDWELDLVCLYYGVLECTIVLRPLDHMLKHTVRLLTHVPCKPTYFFFHSFIVTMSYSLQTSFNRVMEDWPVKYHVWGSPPQGHLQGLTGDN